jgi:hypothetical protein
VVYVAGVLVALLLGFVALVVFLRTSNARAGARLREEIRAYVTSKGGSVTFDDQNGMTVEGPRGRGYEKLTALGIMLSSAKDRPLTIGFALRKYLPDQIDAMFEKSAAKRLDEARQAVDALTPEGLRERLRIRVVSTRAPTTDLATCARPIADGYESRVVLEGFDLDGIPATARARLVDDDATLFEIALGRTLGHAPAAERDEVDGLEWLADPARLFASRSVVVAACGTRLVWATAQPEGASRTLARLASRSGETGPMKYVLLSWNGATLERIGVTVHTIKGPTTPDYTLSLSPQLCAALGLGAGEGGKVGVNLA